MATLIGALVDVSGSMEHNIDSSDSKVEVGPWVRSIFKVIDELIKYDVSSDNHVFGIGFGGKTVEVFDLISTLRSCRPTCTYRDLTLRQMIEKSMSILEEAGAIYVRKWASVDLIEGVVSLDDAMFILNALSSDRNFRYKFIIECLPGCCRRCLIDLPNEDNEGSWQVHVSRPISIRLSAAADVFKHAGVHIASLFKQATKEDIEEVITKAKQLFVDLHVEPVNTTASVFPVQDAADILRGVGEDELTDSRVKELTQFVEKAMYGYTPLFTALKEAASIFQKIDYTDHKKLLFILSDGWASDPENDSIQQLEKAGVTVVCSYITRRSTVEPKRLYSTEQPGWEKAARRMFELSSTLTTQLIPRTIFIKRGWKIDVENNETKLFVQINHPDIIDDVCDLARNVVCCQDALSDILSSVSLDLYINIDITGFAPKEQERGTCYANASAAVLHLAMKRILGRDGGYPDFFVLRKKMIEQYGTHGANTLSVLKAICPNYRLHCEAVDTKGASLAVVAKRPVVARFSLTNEEWESFSEHFRENPTGILTKRQIDITQRQPGATTSGHAVVLVSFNSQCLRLMNSWGSTWADMGFFRIENADVLGLQFFDVFWTLSDLSEVEKAYYERHGKTVAAEYLATLKGLQHSKYKCPSCQRESLVTEFNGTLVRAQCPRCHGEFPSDEAGNILALNMYLTSLSQGRPTTSANNDESRKQ